MWDAFAAGPSPEEPDQELPFLRPPGALPEPEFLAACTRCDDCVAACPHMAIRKAGGEFGEALRGTPIILPRLAACRLCRHWKCIDACLPQALRRVAPPLLNDFISLQKDTALVAAAGVVEALREAQIYASFNFNYTPYLVTAVLFIALTIPLARITDWLGRRALHRQQSAGTV